MSNEMIERVAKAIEKALGYGLIGPNTVARRCIEAMREPTEAMTLQGMLAFVAIEEQYQPNATYKTMIDAALKE